MQDRTIPVTKEIISVNKIINMKIQLIYIIYIAMAMKRFYSEFDTKYSIASNAQPARSKVKRRCG